MELGLFLILLVNIGRTYADANWGPNPLEKPVNQNIKEWKYDSEYRTLTVKFNEEIDEPFPIAYINCIDCETDKPVIERFTVGNEALSGVVIKEKNGRTELQITKKQDYENKDQQTYTFQIVLGQSTAATQKVTIIVLDIDDNPPVIKVNQPQCQIWENVPGKTNCTYNIKDPDTISSVLNITFIFPDEYKNIFEIKFEAGGTENEADAYLNLKVALDYEKVPMYYFTLIAQDVGGNRGYATIVIDVQDVNDEPPKWVDIFATQQFEEESVQKFEVYAVDGDVSIKAEVDYKFAPECHDKVSIVRDSSGKGIITVDKIDRDDPELDFLNCNIMAFETDTHDMNITSSITMIITDINDNIPKITAKKTELELNEMEFVTLEKMFKVNDIDLSENAQYDVNIIDVKNNAYAIAKDIKYSEAFQIIPSSGYKAWEFAFSVAKRELLDYEDENWRNFKLLVESTDHGIKNKQKDSCEISIKLLNLNDEIPYFEKDKNYTVEIKENITINELIMQVQAFDKDIGDKVEYEILAGGDSFGLEIVNDINAAKIKTKIENALDYEKQQQVLIQISARDTFIDHIPTPLHTVTQQITIAVLDVNDEKPRITLPNTRPEIKENSARGTQVNAQIKAYDVDTTAYLEFDIDWKNTWATKQGRRVDDKLFYNVFEIKTDFVQENGKENTGNAIGILSVLDDKKLDYEEFEVIYLQIVVTDTKQEINDGTDTASLAVSLIDENDNPPEFKNETIYAKKSVEENSISGTLIGTIVATDRDGPGNNIVAYTLEPIKPTAANLVKIDKDTGVLTVDEDKAIDADTPKTYKLEYTVMANDGVNNATAKIEIEVKDVNDEKPKLKAKLKPKVEVYEGENVEESLQFIEGEDNDRDYPRNNVTYYLNTLGHQELWNLFFVNQTTGEITVKGKLDRDFDKASYQVFLIMKDNFGENSNINEITEGLEFTVTVLDVNNQKPELPKTLNIQDVSENFNNKDKSLAKIVATDKDEPCSKNTEIEYSILKTIDEEGNEVKDLFTMKSILDKDSPICQYYGELYVNKPLKGHFGTHTISIHTKDHGTPVKEDKNDYEINIIPYNYKTPVIKFPTESARLILNKTQPLNSKLLTLSNGDLPDFEATDDQGNKFEMVFEPVKEFWPDEFKLVKRPTIKNKAQLQLTKQAEKREYDLKIRANHSGSGDVANFVERSFKVQFVDLTELPYFNTLALDVTFVEEKAGLCSEIPKAVDPKCAESEHCASFETYYHITSGDEFNKFIVDATDKQKPQLCVKDALDRETVDSYTLDIYAINDPKPPSSPPKNSDPLVVQVEVEDINDNPPVFDLEMFSGSMTAADPPGRSIVTITATDPDIIDMQEGVLVYSIVEKTTEVSDDSLNKVKDDAFNIKDSNHIVSNFRPTKEMKGFFTFDVKVVDSDELHEAFSKVKIFIISDDNRVVFTFRNDKDTVDREARFIAEVFSQEFGFNCTIDDTYKKVDDDSGQALSNQTDVKTHFIDDKKNEPVEKDIITVKSTDLQTVSRLQQRFSDRGLKFSDVLPSTDDGDAKSMDGLLRTILIVVSVVLGILCIALLGAFVIRTRSLTKRLEAMTTNVFGSTKSDLNRIGTNAPGTNRHAIEANPVWNEDLKDVTQFDTISQASGGSDLIGIEDNPEFEYTNRKDSINPVIQENIRRKSMNPMSAANDDDFGIDFGNFKPTL